ncbi:DNA gyrase, A subunit [Halothermothrix orenii H 168]|uniref:DNA gyrase subunit A n=2 Tax=Halothermothrix orenii TaxID=31909 RepID=B8CZP0_HALOH|nr:DNA gyrase subunit A [Halothermothrix orenii]ACL68770.1 DNA gyrase, A subunit [Halothermothrix orenii H 168]
MVMDINNGKVLEVDIENEMKGAYLDYAMSVIVSRALPDVRDGLKPVQRRILYALHDLGITPNKPHKKSARVVGEVLGKYHPHGDTAVYDTMVRMAQEFSFRYPLVDGHGNFGSIDGDSAAAMRYTEVRMARLTTELLRDIDKNTVDFAPNFDESLEEPEVLPARLPNLLMNGVSGIAVGMSTNIPPHNLGEVIDGVVALIDNPDLEVKDLMKIIKGPDFPTGGIIMGKDKIYQAYKTGRGRLKVRGKARIEEDKNGKSKIIITEIPYQVNKARLVEKIANLVRDEKITGISDLRDESDRRGLRIVIELKKGTVPKVILNRLYKYTQLQVTYGVIMLALVDGMPRVLTLKELLNHYLEHQKEVVTRRTKYQLDKAEARAHILEGLRIALANIDDIVQLIREAPDVDTARRGLIENFNLTEKQAEAILRMRLQRLTGLERDKIEAEYKELKEKIAYYRSILADEGKLLGIIKDELLELKEKFQDERRTEISIQAVDLDVEDLIPEEQVVITLTHHGYIKRMPIDIYRSQRRGGKGIIGINTKEEDFVEHVFTTSTHHYFLFFTNKGKVYRLRVFEIPQASRQARGTAIVNLLELEEEERITTVIPIREFDEERYLVMVTRNGMIKKTPLAEYESRYTGLIGLTLRDEDELIDVKYTDGNQSVIIVTHRGKAIHFKENEVRSMGRTAMGVKAITLEDGDYVVGMGVDSEGDDLLVITEKGYGKRTPLEEYRLQSRGGKGLITANITEKNGNLAGVKVVREDHDLILITSEGIIIRTRVEGISRLGRNTLGVKVIRLEEGDRVVSLARISPEEKDIEEMD